MVRLMLGLAVGVALAACGDATGPDESEPDVATITFRSGSRTQVGMLHTITVPADHGVPGPDSLVLTYVVLPARSGGAGPPVFYLAGGPGDDLIDSVEGDLFDYLLVLREVSDVVLFDQRGAGRSEPGSDCGMNFSLPSGWGLEALADSVVEQYGSCVDVVSTRGIDPSAYTTPASVGDIEAIRAAIGVEQIVVDGYSYGTHLALAYLRAHGSRVARAILHGTEGPDHTLKLPSNVDAQLEAVAAAVAADPEAGAVLPDLVGYVDALVDSADAAPIVVGSGDGALTLNGDALRLVIANLLGDRDDIQFLVLALASTLDDDWSLFAAAFDAVRTLRMPAVMTIAMDCASGATAARSSRIAAEADTAVLGNAINFPFPAICGAVGVPDLGDAYRSPLTSGVPTLFISGTLDGRTPVSNAMEVAEGFSQASHLIIGNAGHAALDTEVDGLAAEVIRFLEGEDLGTVELTMPAIPFVLP